MALNAELSELRTVLVQEIDDKLLTIALGKAGGDQTYAAALLGISLRTLKRRINDRKREDV